MTERKKRPTRAFHFLTESGKLACGSKDSHGVKDAAFVTCGNCRRRLPPAPVEFTPRYHTNETIKPCPDCPSELAVDGDGASCTTCGGVGLVYVTGEQSTENDVSQP